MALYQNLPVYQASYRLLFAIFFQTKNFAREYKYTVGQKLKDECLLLAKNIYRANKAREKESHLEAARENIEVIRLYWRLLFDLKAISLGKHVETSSLIEDVSKQLAL